MDTVTHALVGTAVSDGFFRSRLGPIATPFALAMSALPDIDVITYFIAPEYAWVNHRGYTHSFFVQFLAAPLLGYAGYRLAKRAGTWGMWCLLALLCLVGHTLVDLVTSWGTMPFLPFSSARVSWDVAPILDIFVFSVSAASCIANRLLRREKVDAFLNPLIFPVVHRHPRRRRAGDWVGRVATGLVVLYLLVGWQQNRQTVRIARAELAAMGVEGVEVRAMPLMLTYIAWGIAARDAEGTVYNAVYSSYAPRPMRFASFPTAKGKAVDGALATLRGRMFTWYSQGMYAADVAETGTGVSVYLRDRRFFTLSNGHLPRFVMEFRENAAGGMEWAESIQMGFDGVDLREEAERLWNLTWRGEAAVNGAAGR